MTIALVIEDGTGLSDANSYVSASKIAYADGSTFSCDNYFAERMAPRTVWFPPAPSDPDLTDPNAEIKKACLIKATTFLDHYWRAQFKGVKSTRKQALCWPRVGATIDDGEYEVYEYGLGLIASNEIPSQLKMCCAELAARSAQFGNFQYPGELAPDITNDNFTISEAVGPIKVDYEPGAPAVTIFRLCEMLLAPLVRGGAGMIPLVRG